MRLTLIGASSGVGLLTLQQALAKGHQVTALARNTAAIPDHPLLTKVTGSATSVQDLTQVMSGAEAVIITVGTKKKNATPLFTDTARALLAAADHLNFTAPVLVITGFGAGDSRPYLSWFMGAVIRFLLKKEYDDKTQLEVMLAQSRLKWEIVRPGILTDGPLTGTYKAIPILDKGISVGKISRADVADFLIRQAENPTMLYQYPALTQ